MNSKKVPAVEDNGSRPAIPSETFRFLSDINPDQCNTGLTKREQFAMAAMQGFCSNPEMTVCKPDSIALEAVIHADALLAELDK